MRRHDRIIGLIWFALGSGIAAEAMNLGLGNLHNPGIGFVSFVAGSSLALCGFFLAILVTLKGKGDGEKLLGGQNWRNLVLTVLSIVIYAFLVEPLGFLVTTFLLQFFLLKMTAPKRWLSPVFTSLLIVLCCYLIFLLWLKVPLPKGFLRIG